MKPQNPAIFIDRTKRMQQFNNEHAPTQYTLADWIKFRTFAN